MNKLFTFSCLFLLTSIVYGQVLDLDVNYQKIRRSTNDTAKVNGLNALAKYHINRDQDSGRFYVEKALTLSTALNYQKGIGYAKLTMGILESDLGNFPEGLALILEATTIAENTKEHQLLAGCKLNLGNFYIKTGDIDRALQVYKEGIDHCKKYDIYYTEASLYTSYGMGLKMKGELDSAAIYYEKVLDIHYNVLHDSVVIAAIYNNMASLHFVKNDLKTAENYLLKSYEINKSMGNQRYQLMNLSNLGQLHGLPGGDLEKSKEYFDESIAMATKMRAKEALESIYQSMSEVYRENKKYEEAYHYLFLSLVYKDSIIGAEKKAQISEISEEFKTRAIQDSLQINAQQLKIAQINAEAANLKASKSTWQLLGVLFLMFGVLVILFFVYRNSKNQKRINNLLQDKNDEIYHQKLEIEEKNNELTDSINYAKRIQTALLPSPNALKKILGDHFLLFKPKDIVSGDFYWAKLTTNQHYFAVADCTGHGVPGAMVSMLGYETIEKIALENHTDAAKFMSRVNDELVKALSSSADEINSAENQVKDGMDLSLCIVTDRKKVSFCGANNECFIIRKNELQMPETNEMISLFKGDSYTIIQLKATKRPVGFYHAENEFRSVEMQLLQNDKFYLFSDGYPDQFGGDKGKKMKTSVFKDVLLQSVHQSMADQYTFLNNYLVNWQSGFDQLDDITVLGVRVE